MQNQLIDYSQELKISWKGFNDPPAELRNQIYSYRTLFHNSNGERKIFTVKAFQMRYQMLLPLLCASSEIAKKLRPMIPGTIRCT
jgi:hypothetical protein